MGWLASSTGLLMEEDARLVKDLVLSTVSEGGSSKEVVSLASSNSSLSLSDASASVFRRPFDGSRSADSLWSLWSISDIFVAECEPE
jgi:hypothetical protein